MSYQRSCPHDYKSLSATFTIALITHVRISTDTHWRPGWMRCIIKDRSITSTHIGIDLHSCPGTQRHDQRVPAVRSRIPWRYYQGARRQSLVYRVYRQSHWHARSPLGGRKSMWDEWRRVSCPASRGSAWEGGLTAWPRAFL